MKVQQNYVIYLLLLNHHEHIIVIMAENLFQMLLQN